MWDYQTTSDRSVVHFRTQYNSGTTTYTSPGNASTFTPTATPTMYAVTSTTNGEQTPDTPPPPPPPPTLPQSPPPTSSSTPATPTPTTTTTSPPLALPSR
nr:unnamed protein product [Spirometra erinaceieuropaei]